ncbi:MAG: dUTP diphosphatase [Desulfocapsa sp.]|nr:MAG: dUTP diphosphatase [Desulfocapsa sp.]
MQKIRLKFTWLQPEKSCDLPLPAYQSELAAGMDIAAAIDSSYDLQPGEIHLVPAGFSLAIPDGFEVQIRPRSGLAVKHGITLINSPGTIDADYRGEIKVPLINHGNIAFTINRGDRIAQMILVPVVQADLELMELLDETGRGSGGFGHTGMKG